MKKSPFSKVPLDVKREMIKIWKSMNEVDKEHFTNQVALALSTWGNDQKGLELIAIVLQKLIEDGSRNLADFGIYINWFIKEGGLKIYTSKSRDIRKANILIESYRLKYDLPSEPSKSLFK